MTVSIILCLNWSRVSGHYKFFCGYFLCPCEHEFLFLLFSSPSQCFPSSSSRILFPPFFWTHHLPQTISCDQWLNCSIQWLCMYFSSENAVCVFTDVDVEDSAVIEDRKSRWRDQRNILRAAMTMMKVEGKERMPLESMVWRILCCSFLLIKGQHRLWNETDQKGEKRGMEEWDRRVG